MSFIIDPFRFRTIYPVAVEILQGHTQLARSVKDTDTYTVSVPVQEDGRTVVLMWTESEDVPSGLHPISAVVGGVSASLYYYGFPSGPGGYHGLIVVAKDVPPDGSGNADLVITYSANFGGNYLRWSAVLGATGGFGDDNLIGSGISATRTITLTGVNVPDNTFGICIANSYFAGVSWTGATGIIDATGPIRDSAALIQGPSTSDVTYTGANQAGNRASLMIVGLT